MELEQSVARHYTHGSLEAAVFQAVAASGIGLDRLTPADLAPVDEFHIGGRQATIDFAAQLDLRPDMHLLDIGCGLGGASRYFAHDRGCRVTGIDLTEEFVRVAETLSRRVGLANRVAYRQANALALPFPAGSFDGAYMLHVGMNIDAKAAMFAEIRRLLKPGAVFGIYDVMRTGDGALTFPVPWAATGETSFLETPAGYRRLLEGAGFVVRMERGRRDFAIKFFAQMRAHAGQSGGPPPLGLHILMGGDGPQKVANMIDNLQRGLIAPTEIVGQAA